MGRCSSAEAYQGEMYAVIHTIPTILGDFACSENSGGWLGPQRLASGVRAAGSLERKSDLYFLAFLSSCVASGSVTRMTSVAHRIRPVARTMPSAA